MAEKLLHISPIHDETNAKFPSAPKDSTRDLEMQLKFREIEPEAQIKMRQTELEYEHLAQELRQKITVDSSMHKESSMHSTDSPFHVDAAIKLVPKFRELSHFFSVSNTMQP